MRYIALIGLCLVLSGGPRAWGDEGGKEFLAIPTDASVKPLIEWPLTVSVGTAGELALEGIIVFPLRVMDFIFFPPSYYWDYGTGDFWLARWRRPIAPPEVRPLPAMPRKFKDSEQPRLLPDSLRPDAPR